MNYNSKQESESTAEDLLIYLLINGGDKAVEIVQKSGCRPEWFENKKAYRCMCILFEIIERGSVVNFDTFFNALDPGERSGLIAYVFSSKSERTFLVSGSLKDYIGIVRENYIRRNANALGQILLSCTKQKDIREVTAVLESVTRELQELGNKKCAQKIADIIPKCHSELEERMKYDFTGELRGINTGIPELNNITNGWQPSTLNIIAARPSMGKTAIALHFALAAAKAGKSVCIFSLEMADVKLLDRLIICEANISAKFYRNGRLSIEDLESIKAAEKTLSELPIYIDDNARCTTSYVRANCRAAVQDGKCDIVILDYLQLTDLETSSQRNYNREQLVAKAAREYKILAKELNVPVLLLSQLSRAVETRAVKKPQLSDLRESGAIEQDADLVMFIYRPEYYAEPNSIEMEEAVTRTADGRFLCGNAELIVAKNRDGEVGSVAFHYNRSMTKIWGDEYIVVNNEQELDGVHPKIDDELPF